MNRMATQQAEDAKASESRTRQMDSVLDAFALVISVALLGFAMLRVDSPVRVVMTSAFTLFAPGWAVVTHWIALRKRARFGASIVLSISFVTIGAILSVWLHAWHPVEIMELEALIVIMSVIWGNARRMKAARVTVPPDDDAK